MHGVATRYEIIDIGTLGYAAAINNAGQVVGAASSRTEGGGQRPFMWHDGELTYIKGPNVRGGLARAINERGDIVGCATAPARRAFVIWDGEPASLATLATPSGEADARDINQDGLVVGWYKEQGSYQTTAVAWDNDGVGPLSDGWPELSIAQAANNANLIVGSARTGCFVWDQGRITVFGFTKNGGGAAVAINDAGQVTGSSDNAAQASRAFFWQDGLLTSLGTLGGPRSQGEDINARGVVAGRSFVKKKEACAFTSEHGFIWNGGKMIDLNTLIDPAAGWVIESAHGINDHGQVVGCGIYEGKRRAVLLNPGG